MGGKGSETLHKTAVLLLWLFVISVILLKNTHENDISILLL